MEIEPHDKIVIKPVKMVYPDQAYFSPKNGKKTKLKLIKSLSEGK